MRPFTALALLLALGAAAPAAGQDAGRSGGARTPRPAPESPGARRAGAQQRAPQGGGAQRQKPSASKGKGRRPAPPRPPSPALRTLREEQQRRLDEAERLERTRALAHEELESRRIDAALGGSEREVVAFLLAQEAIHRDRVARLTRLRELAVESKDVPRLNAVDTLERAERARYLELLRSGSRRLSPTTQRDLQARLAVGRQPAAERTEPERGGGSRPAGRKQRQARSSASGEPQRPRRAGR